MSEVEKQFEQLAQRRGTRPPVRPGPSDREALRRDAQWPQAHGEVELSERPARWFDQQEAERAGPDPQARPVGRPKWAIEMVEQEVPPERLLATLVDKVQEEPSEKLFRQAELMLNDIARLDDGPELLKRYVTPELITRLTKKAADLKAKDSEPDIRTRHRRVLTGRLPGILQGGRD